MKTTAGFLLLCLAVSAAPPRPAPMVEIRDFGFKVGRLENSGTAFLSRRCGWVGGMSRKARPVGTVHPAGGVTAEIVAARAADDGADTVAVPHTANADGRRGAHNYHDANFFTFHRVVDFRKDRLRFPNSTPGHDGPERK
ncbi:MAG: hypothetical protein GXP31_04950 [Kiritimatiellaeota bacterium]|nr:hypothetical protein [Kiritimatiellota bacterium]